MVKWHMGEVKCSTRRQCAQNNGERKICPGDCLSLGYFSQKLSLKSFRLFAKSALCRLAKAFRCIHLVTVRSCAFTFGLRLAGFLPSEYWVVESVSHVTFEEFIIQFVRILICVTIFCLRGDIRQSCGKVQSPASSYPPHSSSLLGWNSCFR